MDYCEQKLKKKTENEKEKWRWKKSTFFLLGRNYPFSVWRNFKLSWFQICNQIFHICHGSKVIACQSRPKMPILVDFTPFLPTLTGHNFWSKKDIKNPNTDLKSALSKVFICKKWKYLNKGKNSLFRNKYAPWNYLFNNVWFVSIRLIGAK